MESFSIGLVSQHRRKRSVQAFESLTEKPAPPTRRKNSTQLIEVRPGNTNIHEKPEKLQSMDFQASIANEAKEEKNKELSDIHCIIFGYMFEIPYSKYLDLERYRNPLCRAYIKIAHTSHLITTSNLFGHVMMICILTAGLLVGMESYPAMANNAILNTLNTVVTAAFTLELGLKVMAEGFGPWNFFIGSEWAWNNFDFLIVVICYLKKNEINAKDAQFLRLLRVFRAIKILRRIPQCRVILVGLVGGISGIGYIFLMLLMVFFMFAVFGMMLFGENDPFCFGELHRALITCFQLSTIIDAVRVMYINIWGCHRYPSWQYVPPGTLEKNKVFWCTHPHGTWFAIVFFVFFTILGGLIVMSLFIGTVTLSMAESIEQMNNENEEAERQRNLKKGIARAEQMAKESSLAQSRSSIIPHSVTTIEAINGDAAEKALLNETPSHAQSKPNTKKERELRRLQLLMLRAWAGMDVGSDKDVDDTPDIHPFSRLAIRCGKIAESKLFGYLMTTAILFAGVEAGVLTFSDNFSPSSKNALAQVDILVAIVFTIEVVLKVIAEDFEPWRYFSNEWNIFDFCVVVFSLISLGNWLQNEGHLFMMMRLLKLLRVLKLLKQLPALQVIVQAMFRSFNSIGIIGLIILLFIYIYGNMGMIFFGQNDPLRYGSLHITMFIMFRTATREAWSKLMYINAYGCDQYGYEEWPWMCTHPHPQYLLSVTYHIFDIFICSLVLVTLFIGVVITSLEDTMQQMKVERRVQERLIGIQQKYELSDVCISLYRDVFKLFDMDGGGSIGESELGMGLHAIGKELPPNELSDLFAEVDADGSGEVDFSEFVELMAIFRQRGKEPGTKREKRSKSSAKDRWQSSILAIKAVNRVRAIVKSQTSGFARRASFSRKQSSCMTSRPKSQRVVCVPPMIPHPIAVLPVPGFDANSAFVLAHSTSRQENCSNASCHASTSGRHSSGESVNHSRAADRISITSCHTVVDFYERAMNRCCFCGEQRSLEQVALHEVYLCTSKRWACPCGEEIKVRNKRGHMKECQIFKEHWKNSLLQLCRMLCKEELQRSTAQIVARCRVSPGVALISLTECCGDIQEVVIKLSNQSYREEMKLASKTSGFNHFVTATQEFHGSKKKSR